MKTSLFLLFPLLFAIAVCNAQVSVENLQVENRKDPLALDVEKPRFSWQLRGDQRGLRQSAYEIRVGTDREGITGGKNLTWSSGRVSSDSSVHVRYKGPQLRSGQRYYWQVRVWDSKGHSSPWARVAWWRMGLLQPGDWSAKWIQPGYTEDSVLRPSPLFRKVFNASGRIHSAIAYITCHGLYEAKINGRRVGEGYLTPGWTSYQKRLQYQAYDVTNLISEGKNAISVVLGSGWYRGTLAFEGKRNFYGKDISLLLQLEITYDNGETMRVVSDGSWKSATGSIQYAEIYHGETIDARKEKKGWELEDFQDTAWAPVRVVNYPYNNLVATSGEPVRKHEQFKPVAIFKTAAGEQVIDFGQNLVGWVMVKAKGVAGTKIRISHAEVLDKNGNFYTQNLRSAKGVDTYILSGNPSGEQFEPHFTWHGFRYIKVEGYPGDLTADSFTAVALYSDMQVTGSFVTSNPLLNQLQHNIQWGQKGNFLDVPTDCPQRDERLGWTGDAQVFYRTAAFNMQVDNFFSKWMKDVAADQMQDGSVPFVVPNVLGQAAGSAGWADAATIIPWNMYLTYGDRQVLQDQYESMSRWIAFMESKSHNGLWNTGFHFGDWLFYRPEDDLDGRAAVTDKYLIAQCFFAHSTQQMINTAKILGRKEDIVKYETLLKRIKDAFLREYVTPGGRLVSGTQTAYVLALNFDMLPDSARQGAAERLVQNIADYNDHLTTGFLGTPYLCHVLSRFGYTDVAYRLLLQQTYPSWLYPVKMGATTIWERWNGIKPDSTFANASMNSFNHYAYGAIGDWMYRVIGGLDTYEDSPGYRHIRIRPEIGGGITHAATALNTYYGKIRNEWVLEGDKLSMTVEIPANTTASIYIPADSPASVRESGKQLQAAKGIQSTSVEKGSVLVQVGSGTYLFSAQVSASNSAQLAR